MELLMKLLPGIVAYAEPAAEATKAAINSNFFGVLVSGANMFVNIIKWAALLWVLVKVAMMGFKISTQAKDTASAITTVKNEGVALAIGLFIVMTAFMIHNAMEDTMKSIVSNRDTNAQIKYETTDVFNTENKNKN